MSVVVLTYDHPHRKTEDVVWRLVSVGHLLGDLSIVAIPWVDRPQRRYLYGHRPAEKHWPCEPTIHPRDYFCKYEVAEKGDLYDRIMSKDPDVVVR
jgi:hypothetical protein